MRVTNVTTYRNYGASINSVHSKLNKSMNKISSGSEYEAAAENPLAYFEGNKMDIQYQDVNTKLDVIKDLKSRLELQETGARSIQSELSKAREQIQYIRNDTNNAVDDVSATMNTIKDDLLQKMQTMVNDLNAQYQDFFIYGGNDLSTAPFSLSADGMKLTFTHVYPGDTEATTITMEMKDGSYEFSGTAADGSVLDATGSMEKIREAMSEQGYMDVGYGTIQDKSTLLDTFTGGLNLLTGITSSQMNAGAGVSDADIQDRLNKSAIGLLAQAVSSIDKRIAGGSQAEFSDSMGVLMGEITQTEQHITAAYSDLGNKYSLLERSETKLNSISDALEIQYKEKLGADPYKAITEMYAHQYTYSASLQLSSAVFQSSLFDFIR